MTRANNQIDSEEQPHVTGDWATYKRLISYVRPMWFSFLLAIVGFFVSAGAETYFATLLKEIFNAFSTPVPQTGYFFAGMMLLAVFMRGMGDLSGNFFLSRISFQVIHQLRIELFERLLVLPSRYFDGTTSAKLVSRITFNVAQLKDTATEALKILIQDGAKVIAFMGALLYINWKLTLIFLVIAPVVGLIVAVASKRFRKISERVQSSMSDITHVTSEAVNAFKVIRAFGGSRSERRRFVSTSNTNRSQNLKMVVTKSVSTQVIQLLVSMALALLVVLLFREDVRGEMNAGEIVQYLTLAGFLARPLKKLSAVNARLQKGLAAAVDVFSQLDEEAETDHGVQEVERALGHIEFRDVNFSYAGDRDRVLHGISFQIQPGQTVAIVGQSGSGKSTVAGLIPRFYDVEEGLILLDGIPLEEYTLRSLRKQISLVSQEVTLFNDTLEKNIAYGDLDDSSREAIQLALQGAHAREFVDQMPDGLETLVGDNGILLSGGQRQRIAIARALLKNAPLLILDEATSSLDAESERHIQAALETLMMDKTTLVIAHRLSTVENADLIIVMQDGRIAETGNHTDLMQQEGAYANLYRAQFADVSEPKGAGRKVKQSLPSDNSEETTTTPITIRASGRKASRLLETAWYNGSYWPRLLYPLSTIYGWYVKRRRIGYLTGKKSSWRASAPVIIVGNLTVGGTGKTPFVIWLADQLSNLGYRPGIVSRGYGGKSRQYPLSVSSSHLPQEVGDEPLLLVQRTACPVVVDPDRASAVRHLLKTTRCDVVISDDGLQHYQLARDVEIVVLDAARGFGNKLCLPAGPMREPVERLKQCDLIVSNGENSEYETGAVVMHVEPRSLVNLANGQRISPESFQHKVVHAVVAVGNPDRFLLTLSKLGIEHVANVFADHHDYVTGDVSFADVCPVVMTEKDAVKIRRLAQLDLKKYWYLEVEVRMSDADCQKVMRCLQSKGVTVREQ